MHNIILESRKKATLCGVKDVLSYNDNSIIAITELGTITIKGSELHIDKLNTEQGDLIIGGNVDSMVYGEIKVRGSAFKNLFK